MTQELRQTLKLTQQLIMTPQLQQAIKLLQLTRLELATAIEKELLENPVLEEIDETVDAAEARETLPQMAKDEEPQEPPSISENKDIDWKQYLDHQSVYDYQGGYNGDEEREELESTLTKSANLQDHLVWQLQMSGLTDFRREIAEYLINDLNDDGYLKRTIEEVAAAQNWPLEDVEEALLTLQEFDPPGVAARDLRECLLIQLRQLGGENPLLKKLVENHLPDLESRNYKPILTALRISMEELGNLIKFLGHLEPKPGRPFGGSPTQYIVPDIYVVKIKDEYVVVLNDDGLPRLRVSNYYKELLSRPDLHPSGKEKEYIQERLRSAAWMIRSIHQRQRTIYKVTKSIVKYQHDFFEKGVTALAPLILRDVAEDIEMHESTISRATTNKYVHTPQGIFELKFFFNSGIDSRLGDQVASEAVKTHLAKIIENENPKKPYSDQEIVDLLNHRHGIVIARRTVTKYREMLNILSSTKRKKHF